VWFEPYVAPWARSLREERGFWLYPTPQERETLTDSEVSDSASSHCLQSSEESVVIEVEVEQHPLRKMANVIKIRAFKGLCNGAPITDVGNRIDVGLLRGERYKRWMRWGEMRERR
jgi:hypothetical protein